MAHKHKRDPDLEDFDDLEEEDEKGGGKEKPALTHLSYQELTDQLTAAETRAEKNHENILRLQAEFDNVRKRNERDLVQAHKYALEKIAQELLPVIDNLERGLAQMSGEELAAVRTGIELTLKQLQGVFEKFAIKTIDPQGKSFDPTVHEAMATRVSDAAAGTVIEVLQKGYQLNDRLLRPALVVVAKAAE